jgi:hypothetical protein
MEVGLAMTLRIIFCAINHVSDKLHNLWHKTGRKYEPRFPSSGSSGSSGSGIENLNTMDLPYSGYSATDRAVEYRLRGQSPSGVINGIYQ